MASFKLQVILFVAVVAVPSYSSVVKRHARPQDDECRPRPPSEATKVTECCPLPDIMIGNSDLLESCLKEVESNPAFARPPPPGGDNGQGPPPGKPDGPHAHFACVDECIFNKTGLVSEDGKINKDNIKKKAGDLASADSSWGDIAKTAVEKCLEMPEHDLTNRVCKSGSFEFNGCFSRELFLNCPADKFADNDECAKIKERVSKCPHGLPPFM